MSHLSYSYSQGNRLQDRNTYFYSAYRGSAFLSEWMTSRQSSLSLLPKPKPLELEKIQVVSTIGYDTSSLLARLLSPAETQDKTNRELAER